MRNFVHHNAQEVASAAALGQHFLFDFPRLQSRNPERLALQPIFHHSALVPCRAEVAINRFQHIENVHLRVELSESACGKKEVIKIARSRAWAAHNEYWRLHAYQQIPS